MQTLWLASCMKLRFSKKFGRRPSFDQLLFDKMENVFNNFSLSETPEDRIRLQRRVRRSASGVDCSAECPYR